MVKTLFFYYYIIFFFTVDVVNQAKLSDIPSSKKALHTSLYWLVSITS